MHGIDISNLILESEVFNRIEIEKRMKDGGFNSLSRFELFIWDLEMFLQLQRKLGDKIILKGGAAAQFYVPITSQRTSVDIDMICLASREEVHKAIADIEVEFNGDEEYCKFRKHEPQNPRLHFNNLETYFVTVPSVCDFKELYATKGRQEVKIEFLYSENKYSINKAVRPELFALETDKEFNVLSLEDLFADKLTTLGPDTIGVSDEREDEQFKQIYDVITLFLSNREQVINNRELILREYEKASKSECLLHGIDYEPDKLYNDMKLLVNRLKNIDGNQKLQQRANDFQSLYLRSVVKRDKAGWAIAGYQLDFLIDYILKGDTAILQYIEINKLIEELKFEDVTGPERGDLIRKIRETLSDKYGSMEGLSEELFRKRFDRIIWELIGHVPLDDIRSTLRKF